MKDDLFTTVFKNAGKLASGKLMGAILGFAALYSAGKNMTTHDFGTLMLIVAYVQTITAFGQFQSWQIALHYGAAPWQRGDKEATKIAIQFALALDVMAGFVSMAFGIVILLLFGHKLGVYHAQRMLALFYCTQIPMMCMSSCYGILRLFDRIDIVANQQIIGPFIRSLCALITWFCGFGLTGFVVAWYMGQLSTQIFTWVSTWRVLKQFNMTGALSPSFFKALKKMPKGTWRFAWTASFTKSLESFWEPVSCLIVGKALSPSAAGLYSLAMQFLNAVQRPAALLEKSYYPEVVRLDPRTLKPWRLAFKTSILSILLALCAIFVVAIGGDPVISLFGHRYVPAASLMLWMSPALIFYTAGLPMEGVLYSAGRSEMIMVLQFISVIFYLPALYIGCHYGLHGVGLAYVFGVSLFNILTFIVTLYTFYRRDEIISPHEREVLD